MSNTWDLWSQWKEDLLPYYKQAETGLLGRKDIVAGKDMGTRSGGVLGADGLYDRGIDYAGKKLRSHDTLLSISYHLANSYTSDI